MTTTELSFLHAICAAPKDDTPRLVYADYLEGLDTVSVLCSHCGGNPIRKCVWPPSSTRWLRQDLDTDVYMCCACHGTGYTTDTSRRDRAEFVRIQVALAQMEPHKCPGVGISNDWCSFCGGRVVPDPDGTEPHAAAGYKACSRRSRFRRREREFVKKYGATWAEELLSTH